MVSQTETSQFSAFPPSHIHFNGETCPSCGQAIPPDKLEEIKGKIAVREREQTLTITAHLEEQHAKEKAQADAKAKADLESERQQSTAREARVREEDRRAAEDLLNEKIAEAERGRQELLAISQQQIAVAEAARQSAERTGVSLTAELNELRQASATALETVKAEAKKREVEIRNQAKQAAESALAERVATIEAARSESEAGLQARITEAEATRIAAEEKGVTLTLQLDELRRANEAEVARVKEGAATEAVRIRQAATEAVETRFRDTFTAQETALAEANVKARQAESEVLTLTERHASAMEENLNAQRQILEKAREDAVNVEKAKAFEENQKLANKVSDLQRALEKKTAEDLGEGAEIDLFDALKKEFPNDDITRISKGAPGADIRHIVMLRGQECGTILYDSKNHNGFRWEHVTKLKTDQLAAKAEHAILSTHKFPQGARQFHIHDGVLLANPARVVAIATLVRQHLLHVHTLRLSSIERERKTSALYEFITSERYSLLLQRIDERATKLLEEQAKEIKWHENNWRKQGEAYRAIQKAKAHLENETSSIIGTSADDSVISEAS
jgi:hypothetical protein